MIDGGRAGGSSILIHTSVKLVTLLHHIQGYAAHILIHTSVKLVTDLYASYKPRYDILIHTSVKLVTHPASLPRAHRRNFNPHEREARDERGNGPHRFGLRF